ncbi:GNAT family N-acetyltransferase [Kibdelosporangium phytohabitans]|uniref:GNAT family N-acetyltransferase n=1 Tax=Kibdelosporangium phytohabitans TaxID=860235 RepID=UPI000A73B536|nr:GNAT family protein [Kibdelosporangium phytohabitans]MBE1470106.1 hypothetical protein [Kibdelosporangium phytohabitans]
MPQLKRLAAGHAPAVLASEPANRACFAAAITDRGDDFFEQFADLCNARLAEQDGGVCAFHVLVADDGSVLGRFNLLDIEDRTAELGYRVAQHAAGRGVATATVRELCGLRRPGTGCVPAGGHGQPERRVPEGADQSRAPRLTPSSSATAGRRSAPRSPCSAKCAAPAGSLCRPCPSS